MSFEADIARVIAPPHAVAVPNGATARVPAVASFMPLTAAESGVKAIALSVPLTAAAALGALAFGHVDFGVTASLAIGSVPAVFVGSLFSSLAPDRYVRPVITFVIAASGLKYVGIDTTTLGWLLCAALLVIAAAWLLSSAPGAGRARPWGSPASSRTPLHLLLRR